MPALVLRWGGQDHEVPDRTVIRLGAELEDMLSTDQVNAWDRFRKPGRMNLNLIAMAYGHALRTAGARCTDAEVRAGLFYDGAQQQRILEAIAGLQMIMAPPAPLAAEIKPGKTRGRAKG